MNCDATCLATGPASLLLDPVGFLILFAIALYAMRCSAAVILRRVFVAVGLGRSKPSLYQKCLAVHMQGAEARSALQ